jgi:hypothetical protein
VGTPAKLSTDPVGEGAGIEGTAVPLRPRLQASNDICLEITDENLCHWPPSLLVK